MADKRSPYTPHMRRVARARWAPLVNGGGVICPFCNTEIEPFSAWDIDHEVPLDIAPGLAGDPGNHRPAHSRCNRASGSRYGNAKRRAIRKGTPWARPGEPPAPKPKGPICQSCGRRAEPGQTRMCIRCEFTTTEEDA